MAATFYTRLKVVCDPDFSEILMAEIAEAGFDTFMETEGGFEAYGEENHSHRNQLLVIKGKYAHVQPLLFYEDRVQKRNWNKEWEKHVDPVVVEGKCLIRAAFHKVAEKYPYEIIITPKMSFGTGHHQTTYLMIKAQLSLDHTKKRVMDAGCGTAILSIMASLRGASIVEAFDIDAWSIENGRDNIKQNKCRNIRIQQGTIRDFTWDDTFDIILANINKNILLDELPVYARWLRPGGTLLMSGFYEHDVKDLFAAAAPLGLKPGLQDVRETWASALLKK